MRSGDLSIHGVGSGKRRTGRETENERLIASATCVEPKFRTMLLPYTAGQPLPTTTWNRGRTELTVAFADQRDVLTFTTTDEDGTKITLKRQPETR